MHNVFSPIGAMLTTATRQVPILVSHGGRHSSKKSLSSAVFQVEAVRLWQLLDTGSLEVRPRTGSRSFGRILQLARLFLFSESHRDERGQDIKFGTITFLGCFPRDSGYP